MQFPNNQAVDLIHQDFNAYLAVDVRNVLVALSVQSLFETIRLRDPGTAKHSIQVGTYSYLLARKYDAQNAIEYFIGGLVYDIGKIAFPDYILSGKKLVGDSLLQVQRHVSDSVEILKRLHMPHTIMDIAKYHHERYDGSGYLKGLKGKNIPIAGRIVAVTDVYSAITENNRSYQAGRTHQEAISILSESRERFDPDVLKSFFDMFNDAQLIAEIARDSITEELFSFDIYIESIKSYPKVASW